MKLVGISGSLRAESNNTKLIKLAEQSAPDGVQFTVATVLSELPHFNPDTDVTGSALLADWIDLIRQSDGLVISTPEYARGYPGTLKNAFDWLVQTDAHVDKPFMLLNATDRSTVARETLSTVIETMSGVHITSASTTVPLLGRDLSTNDVMQDTQIKESVAASLTEFVAQIRAR